jgi:hypothetical protein
MALLLSVPAPAAGIYDLELVPVKPQIRLIRSVTDKPVSTLITTLRRRSANAR